MNPLLRHIAGLAGLTVTLGCTGIFSAESADPESESPAPSTEPDPEPEPEPSTEADTGKPEAPEKIPLPDGVSKDVVLCLPPEDAAPIAESDVRTGACPSAIGVKDAATRSPRWGQRTGGGWSLDVRLAEADSSSTRCCYEQVWTRKKGGGRGKGRPLLLDGEMLLPPLFGPIGTGAAASWREDARLEASSVLAFQRAALELQALGAPRHLVQACLRAAEDEQRHATLCLQIARQLDGLDPQLGPCPVVPARSLDLPALAQTTLIEGAIPETLAAAEARVAAARCRDPRIREVLETIASDEQRHADLGWAIIGWARQRGGTAVDRVLAESFPAWPTPTSTRDDASGRLGTSDRRAIVARVQKAVLAPLRTALREAA